MASSKPFKAPKGSKAIDRQIKKATKKASKSINKSIKKSVKKLHKQIQKKKKQKTKLLEKRQKKLDRYIKKAEELNNTTQSLVNQFRGQNYAVENAEDLEKVKRTLKKLSSKRPTEKSIEIAKELSSITTYDNIKIIMPIRDEETDEDGDVIIPKENEVSLKELRRVLKKQVNTPDNLSERQQQIVAQYAKSVAGLQSYFVEELPDMDNDKAVEKFSKKFKSDRDVAIGGNSMLINDLSYTYDALWEGRKFVELMQKVMSNSKEFLAIESWYRSKEATEVRDKIAQAVKSSWYEKFKEFSASIIEFIANLQGISNESRQYMDSYIDEMEVAADEVYTEF